MAFLICSQECVVCKKPANGLHYGKMTCHPCAVFFGAQNKLVNLDCQYADVNDEDEACNTNPREKHYCAPCRYAACFWEAFFRLVCHSFFSCYGKRPFLMPPPFMVANNQYWLFLWSLLLFEWIRLLWSRTLLSNRRTYVPVYWKKKGKKFFFRKHHTTFIMELFCLFTKAFLATTFFSFPISLRL